MGGQTTRNVLMDKGVYSILMELTEEKEIAVGKLGSFLFPPGYYVYTGRAMRNLTARINRHKREEKKLFWHIDYFLNCSLIKALLIIPTGMDLECRLNNQTIKLERARIIVPGFGSSDCRCSSHLIFFSSYPMKELITILLDFREILDIDYVIFEL